METSPITVLRGHNDAVNCVSFLSESLLASGSVDGVLIVWNLETRRPEYEGVLHGRKSVLSSSLLSHRNNLVT